MRRFKLTAAAVAASALCLAAGVVYSASPASAQTAGFVQINSWGSGYQGQINVTNGSSSPISSWKVEFSLPSGTTIAQSWSSNQTSSGNTYTFTNMPWNGNLGPGASTSFGFIANGSGLPFNCTINGASCNGDNPPPPPPPSSSSAPPPPPPPPPSSSAPPPPPPPPSSSQPPPPPNGTPVGINGRLHVCKVNLCNEAGSVVQLRGVSTHGLQWHGSVDNPKHQSNCETPAAMDALAKDWKADVIRIAMYVQEGGYETNPDAYTANVDNIVDMAEARGMYAIVDFHTLTPGDPNYNVDRAKTFFAHEAERNAGKKNVLYEITNEPNGVDWSAIKRYADQVIPVIRAKDPKGVIIVGTPGWSSLGKSGGGSVGERISDPNVMYTFHFYAASHGQEYRDVVTNAIGAGLPVFVTEWGTVTYTGGGGVDENSSRDWLSMLDSNKISHANWTFSDHDESSAALVPGTCNGTDFSSDRVLTQSGRLVKANILAAHN